MFMHNQDIDHLYSLAFAEEQGTQQFGQFGINSIRMKAALGIAGHAFQTGHLCEDQSKVIPEEKDQQKLRMEQAVIKVVAVPILDRQNGVPLAVLSLYNPQIISTDTLQDISQVLSHVMFTLESL